jgi:hypothetical protein
MSIKDIDNVFERLSHDDLFDRGWTEVPITSEFFVISIVFVQAINDKTHFCGKQIRLNQAGSLKFHFCEL